MTLLDRSERSLSVDDIELSGVHRCSTDGGVGRMGTAARYPDELLAVIGSGGRSRLCVQLCEISNGHPEEHKAVS